jgi:hypothetical protein
LRCPVDLAIGTGGRRCFNEGGNHIPDSLAYFVRALGNDPPHKFQARCAISRYGCKFERLGERSSIVARPTMI